MPKKRSTILGSCIPNLEPAAHWPAETSEVGVLADPETIQPGDLAPAARLTVRPSRFTPPQVFATGATIQHATSKGKASVYQPDDLTQLGNDIFVAFQNNVGPDGTPMSDVSDSTIVEFSSSGKKVKQWDIAGDADGIAALPAKGEVIVTTNEDANAHLSRSTPRVQSRWTTASHRRCLIMVGSTRSASGMG